MVGSDSETERALSDTEERTFVLTADALSRLDDESPQYDAELAPTERMSFTERDLSDWWRNNVLDRPSSPSNSVDTCLAAPSSVPVSDYRTIGREEESTVHRPAADTSHTQSLPNAQVASAPRPSSKRRDCFYRTI